MERHKKEKKHRKKAPRVPIKTYKWEDIRRARLKGGYPWTYLYKEPFKEHIDPKFFIMEPSPKSRSSSALQTAGEGVDIKEVTNGVDGHDNIHGHLTPEPSGYIVITEVPSDSENHSKNTAGGGSVTIEDVEEPEILNLESAESSDNISQYLDKEETGAESAQAAKTSTNAEASTSQNGRQERAKSEEPKKKRKRSIDSSYSRKSLSKLAIMKKLREAKEKIKSAKISLPNLQSIHNLRNLPFSTYLKPDNTKKSKKEPEEKSKPKDTIQSPPTSGQKPVYIHIPLKPPEGQTDEFSYLEFGEKKPDDEKPKPPEPEEIKENEENKNNKQGTSSPARPSSLYNDDQRRYSEHPDDIVAIEILKSQTIELPTPSANDVYLLQPEDGAHSDDIIVYLPGTSEPELSRSETRLSVKTPSRQNSKRIRAKSAEPERKRKLSIESSRSLSRTGLLKKLKSAKDKLKVPTFSLSRSNSKKEQRKKTKDEPSEPKEIKKEVKKEETTTGKAPQYIHIPLKPPPGQTDEFSYLEFEEKEEPKEVVTSTSEPAEKEGQSSVENPPSTTNESVQFIVLTPPSDDEILDRPDVPETPSVENKNFFEIHELKEIAKGAMDEVSPETRRKQLQAVTEEGTSEKIKTVSEKKEQESKEEKEQESQEEKEQESKEEKEQESKEEKEQESKKEKEQESKEEEKELKTKEEKTKTKVDKKKSKAKEKEKTDQDIKKDAEKKKEEPQKVEKMVVDEEDGLKLTESAMAKQEQNIKSKEVKEPSQDLKSSLKVDGSPVLKKKVSFKRKSRDDSKDGVYEDIQAPNENKTKEKKESTDEHQKGSLAEMGNSQSMSVDEEKGYLDEKKIIKDTSLEEDYNRWSKLSDHEYEPVNPPADDHAVGWKHPSPLAAEPPTVHVTDTSRAQPKPASLASSTTSLDRRMLGGDAEHALDEPFTVEEMQSQIESKYFSSKTPEATAAPEPKKPAPKAEGPGRIQQAIKAQTGKWKSKLHGIKKPNIKLPSKPNLDRFKFEKPHITLPKMPDTSKINLPTFSLPRKNPLKRSLKQRQLSTESNAGDTKKNYFDFRTYPRLFKKKQKNDFDSSFSSKSEREVPEFATVPRTKRHKEEADRWGGRDTIRIPLHAEDSIEGNEREDSVERRMASHMRYDQDIDIDDAFEKENQEIHTASPFSHDYNSRWNHGRFHPEPNIQTNGNRNQQITDLDSPEDMQAPHESFDTNTSKDMHSSESSLGIHRRGVLEEIDSDEFFLRQKGISQDNIEVGMYLSSEIREAFKSPSNALADLQIDPREFSYETRASNQSLPETPKRKVMKKPKRKKTPHVSQEQISFDQDSEQEFTDMPPARPKRRSKRNRKPKDEEENVIPYQETIAVEENLGILRGPRDESEEFMYENEQMEGKEQPEIKVTDPYAEFRYEERPDSDEDIPPAAPPRKQRSLKSLNYSEHDSILGEFNLDKEPPPQHIEIFKTEYEYIIPTPEPEVPPIKPPRTLSRSSSKSRENEEIQEVVETPLRPVRTRSRSRTRSQADSLNNEEPCIEEPCVKDIRDSMGYAVIDKNSKREPPLPPPRTPPRRKRSVQSTKSSISERKFFTVPRPLNDEPPMRPCRNYSTLGPSRPPRRKPTMNMTDEEKENIDITQYIEIDDEPNRNLHSGKVIQKMKDRPLPAPPRPPRKSRALQDITSQENIAISSENLSDDIQKTETLEETQVSTQTEPLPDDFECEDIVREEAAGSESPIKFHTEGTTLVEKRLITPTHYTYEEETITHGSLVVEPLNGAKILPDSEISRRETPIERSIPITKEYDDETSEIPEEFTKFKDPTPAPQVTLPVGSTPTTQINLSQPSVIERIIERPVVVQPDSSSEIEVLRAQKLQVSDLDVDRLSVNELLASKIIVSEIDSGSIQTNEIGSKSGALKVGEIELPPGVVQQLFEKLQSVAQEQQSSKPTEATPATDTSTQKEEDEDAGQKKNSV